MFLAYQVSIILKQQLSSSLPHSNYSILFLITSVKMFTDLKMNIENFMCIVTSSLNVCVRKTFFLSSSLTFLPAR